MHHLRNTPPHAPARLARHAWWLSVSVLAALGALKLPWNKRSVKELPGNLGLPFLGETLSYARNPHEFFEARTKAHGPVFKTRILGKDIACFVGPDAFTYFADSPDLDRVKGTPSHIRRLLCEESLPVIDGEEHATMRSLVLQAFAPDAIATDYLPALQRITEACARRWADSPEIVWVDEYKKLSAAVCGHLFLGADDDSGIGDGLVPVLDALLAGLSSIPLNLPFTTYGKAIKSRDRLLSLIDDAVRSHREAPRRDMLSRLLAAKGEDGSVLGESQLRAQMVHMFFAAYGGIFRVLSLLSLELALNAEVRERARAEVRSVAPTGDVTLASLMRMPFMEQVTFEVRRHNRIFASTFFDHVSAPLNYQGYEIPAGWTATGGIYMTMQDPLAFSAPHRFDPERFGPDREEHHRTANAYVPQGGGAMTGHRCPAEDLTTHIMKLVGAVLLRSYSWELPAQDLTLNNEPSPLPRDGIRAKVSRLATE